MRGTRSLRGKVGAKLVVSLKSMLTRNTCQGFLLLLGLLLSSACSGIEAPDAAGPRAPGPAYPVRLIDDGQREEAARAVWRQLAQQIGIGDEVAVSLHPDTATIASLSPEATVYLPKVGAGAEMTETELRESLRRFINTWQRLIGAEPAQLSLVDRQDLPDATKEAHYEQRPFRYPLRGEYGSLRIHFGPDRRVLQLTSTCIPEAERIQSAISAIEPQLNREEAAARVRNSVVTFTDAQNALQSYTVPPDAEVEAETLVVHARRALGANGSIEFRLAWELALSNAPVKVVYLDSLNGEILGAA